MIQLMNVGNSANIPIHHYYTESEAEVSEIPKNAPTGSTVMILTKDKGLIVKMKHSDGSWQEI